MQVKLDFTTPFHLGQQTYNDTGERCTAMEDCKYASGHRGYTTVRYRRDGGGETNYCSMYTWLCWVNRPKESVE